MSNGVVISICLLRGMKHHRGVVFTGTDRKAVLERALTIVTPQEAESLRRQVHDFIEGRVDEGRADITTDKGPNPQACCFREGASLFYSPCEVVP